MSGMVRAVDRQTGILRVMRMMLSAFWRSVAYCLHPRVIGLSVLPLVLMVAASFALGYLFWDAAVQAVLVWLEEWELIAFAIRWIESLGAGGLKAVLAPLIVLLVATPVIVVMALLLVSLLMTPAMVDLVAQRRFPALARLRGGGFWASLGWSLWSTLVALVLLLVSLPFWLIPPLVLILPPLIWGWLTYRVFAYDALAEHASTEERKALMQAHRARLLAMGVLSGYLGAAPSLLWASGAMFIAMAPILVPLAVWVYALVFAFASLWFTHYLLEALNASRSQPLPEPVIPSEVPPLAALTDHEVIDVPSREVK
jgi:hypothetical protein